MNGTLQAPLQVLRRAERLRSPGAGQGSACAYSRRQTPRLQGRSARPSQGGQGRPVTSSTRRKREPTVLVVTEDPPPRPLSASGRGRKTSSAPPPRSGEGAGGRGLQKVAQ